MQLSQLSQLSRAEVEEVERRVEEAEDYLEAVAEARTPLAQELSHDLDGAFPDGVAEAAAEAACEAALAVLKGAGWRGIRRRIDEAVLSVVGGRLEAARAYLALVQAARAATLQSLPRRVCDVIAARLDSLEDVLTLDLCDWDRLCAIVLPERDEGAFRRQAGRTLGLWQTLVAKAVLPEAFMDPPEAPEPIRAIEGGPWAVPGTTDRVDVYAERYQRGWHLYRDGDLDLTDRDAIAAPQAPGNGRKWAATIDGEVAERHRVEDGGCRHCGERHPFTADVCPITGDVIDAEDMLADPDWWKMRPPTPRGDGDGGQVPAYAPGAAVADVKAEAAPAAGPQAGEGGRDLYVPSEKRAKADQRTLFGG